MPGSVCPGGTGPVAAWAGFGAGCGIGTITGVRFTGECSPRLTPLRQEAVYRIAQEALHNALRHATPTTVQVRLSTVDGSAVLEIIDDGTGFEPDAAGGAARRLGLASMRERARAAGGRLTVRSRPGAGTTVRVEVPTGG